MQQIRDDVKICIWMRSDLYMDEVFLNGSVKIRIGAKWARVPSEVFFRSLCSK